MNEDTILTLEGIGVPRYSARGLSQTLEPIQAAAHIERSVNGELIDFGYAPFRKYRTAISGTDQRPPAVDGLWPGRIITVDCIAELAAAESLPPARPVVEGSERTEEGFMFYRPRLVMMVMAFTFDTDEWGARINWTLEAEEQ